MTRALEYGRNKAPSPRSSPIQPSWAKNSSRANDPLTTYATSMKGSCICGGGCPRCAPVQAKMAIGKPNDRYEREADQIAEQVMRAPDPIHRKSRAQTFGGEALRAKRASGADHPKIVSQAQIHAAECPGCSLSQATRDFFEPRFGRNFDDVKVHTCDDASQMCSALQARAFTHGNNIFFNRGAYDPGSTTGKSLLAHELTHVVQQSSDTMLRIQRWPEIPGIGPLDVCVWVEGRKVCGSDAKAACEKVPWLPGCKTVCKMLGCKKPPKEKLICPPGFLPGRTTKYKGLCCIGTIESDRNCCPRGRASWMEYRCCAEDEFVSKEGRCIKYSLPILCPHHWKTTLGECCFPPRVPHGRLCILPVKPTPPKPKPPVAPPVPKPKEIFFEIDRPRVTETMATALKASTTKTGYSNFEALVAQMKLDSTLCVQLVGKASPEGPDIYNMNLGARRAELVKTALVDKGIVASRILDPPTGALDPGCKKIEPGVASCGEIGATSKRDRQVKVRLFRGK